MKKHAHQVLFLILFPRLPNYYENLPPYFDRTLEEEFRQPDVDLIYQNRGLENMGLMQLLKVVLDTDGKGLSVIF